MADMTKEGLYDAAFRYKKSRLWKKLWDSDVFALRLKNGETGYISIMGHNGEHCAIGVYVGEKAFRTYRSVQCRDIYLYEPGSFEMRELLLQQDCLQLVLDTKEYLFHEEIDEVRKYAKERGIRLAGKNAYPHFVKYIPDHHPWKVTDKRDMNILQEAAESCVLLAEELENRSPQELGIFQIGIEDDVVPCFSVSDGHLKEQGTVRLPDLKEPEYEKVIMKNETGAAMVKKLPHDGICEGELVRLTQPIQEEKDDAPYYPVFLFMVDSQRRYIVHVMPHTDFEEDPANVLNDLAQGMRENGTAPKLIRCYDERTFCLLEDFGKKTGIRTVLYDGSMPALEEAKDGMLYEMGEHGGKYAGNDQEEDDNEAIQELGMLIEYIINEPEPDTSRMPEGMIDLILQLADREFFDAETCALLKKKLGRIRG